MVAATCGIGRPAARSRSWRCTTSVNSRSRSTLTYTTSEAAVLVTFTTARRRGRYPIIFRLRSDGVTGASNTWFALHTSAIDSAYAARASPGRSGSWG